MFVVCSCVCKGKGMVGMGLCMRRLKRLGALGMRASRWEGIRVCRYAG